MADFEAQVDEQLGPDPDLASRLIDVHIEVGSTLVNLCCMYSSIQKHDIALSFAKRANTKLEKVFKQEIDNIKPAVGPDAEPLSTQYVVLLQTLASSYHNTGAELEHLGDQQACLKYHILAFSVINRYFGKDHALCKLFQSAFVNAQAVKKKLDEKQVSGKRKLEQTLWKGKVHPLI